LALRLDLSGKAEQSAGGRQGFSDPQMIDNILIKNSKYEIGLLIQDLNQVVEYSGGRRNKEYNVCYRGLVVERVDAVMHLSSSQANHRNHYALG